MGIKRKNLDKSLVQWLMSVTGLGPGIGEIRYLCSEGSATNKFYEWLRRESGVDAAHIHFSLTDALANCTAYRNDVVLVLPGLYTETAEIAWSKAWTHLIGLGGSNTYGDWAEPNCVIRTTGTGVVDTIDVTGQLCQFHNVAFNNYGANAACKDAMQIDKYGILLRNVRIQGNMTSAQAGNATCASLYLTGNAFYPVFENCIIGDNEWGTRTQANSGQVYFPGAAGAPSNGLFRNCRFLSNSSTATVAMVRMPAVDYCGRGWLFDNCFFHNESGNQTAMNQVFSTVTAGSDNLPVFSLHHCMASGYDEWQDEDTAGAILADMPIVGTGGGLGRLPNGTTGN